MRISVLFGLRRRLRTFHASQRGNVTLTFALAAIPMLALVGAAIDYSRGSSARAAMQSAGDATALMLSKIATTVTPDQLDQKATELFGALFRRSDVIDVSVTPGYSVTAAGSYKLTFAATGKIPTVFTKFIGSEYIDLGTSSEVVWGVKKLELALALDVTLSMDENNKIGELKKAAKNLLTTLKKAAPKDGDIKVAVVPFSVHVNVDPTNVNATWLDWSDWMAEPASVQAWLSHAVNGQRNRNAWDRAGPGASCPFTTGDHGFRCANGPAHKQNDSTVSTIPSSGSYSGRICPSRDDGSKSQMATTGNLANRYHNGCYTSVLRPNFTDWHPVKTGSGADCDGLASNKCQCTGSSSNKVCAFIPGEVSHAQGSGASCGNLPNPSVCQCQGTGSNKVCRQKTYDHVWQPRPKTAWNGCVRDRNQDFDADDTMPSFAATDVSKTNTDNVTESYRTADTPATADAFQPFQYQNCPTPILPLTSDWDTLEKKVDALTPVDATNTTIGMAWAYHALTQSAPLTNAAAPVADLDKVIILLSDGLNTQNRWRAFDVSKLTTGDAQIDERLQAACAKVRDANIQVYTIRVLDGNAKLLQSCATKPDMYYEVKNASQLDDVFGTIAESLTKLRIAK
jgi:Flp pilus assembly protein TadG